MLLGKAIIEKGCKIRKNPTKLDVVPKSTHYQLWKLEETIQLLKVSIPISATTYGSWQFFLVMTIYVLHSTGKIIFLTCLVLELQREQPRKLLLSMQKPVILKFKI